MIDLESILTAQKNLSAQGWRTTLTVMAIVLGITSIITMMSLGEGLNASVNSQFETLGTHTLTVLPGKGFLESAFVQLEKSDVKTIESVRGVEFATEIYLTTQQFEYKNQKKTLTLIGVDPSKTKELGTFGLLNLANGRPLESKDKSGIIIGPKIENDTFEHDVFIKSEINAGEFRLKVVGINQKSENSIMGSFFDSAILMNSETLTDLNPTAKPSRIFVKILDDQDPAEIQSKIEEELERNHDATDFQVLTADQIAQTAGSVIGIIQLVLVGIAAISLVVGGVGVMNTMYMSVTERTSEVGIMKAIGATNTQIRDIFLLEALLIGIAGGIIGTILGILLATLVSIIASAGGFDLQAVVTIPMIALAVGFSMAICLVFGYWPAKQAAEQDPVEAIRKNS